MPDLIAQGPLPDDRWRRSVESGARFRLGREAGPWSTPWDHLISRQHVDVTCVDGQLHVEALPAAANPVFFRGQAASKFQLQAGEHFVIGQTTFSFVDPRSSSPSDLPGPTEQRTFVTEDLLRQPFREPDKRIAALSRLPDVIHRSTSDQQLFQRLVNLLLSGTERATAAAIVTLHRQISPATDDDCCVSILHWDRHLLSTADFHPSRRLIRQAISSGQSVAYIWGRDSRGKQTDYTLSDQTEWAICTPVRSAACPGWALYVGGSFQSEFPHTLSADPEILHDDVKYTEIMAATLGGLLESRALAARQASLSQFFSAPVLGAISAGDPEQVLAPREADVTVLFCDLRGFSSESERSADDLFGLLRRVSDALGVMTREILQQGGVIGDFHGDAAMGFWGWPIAQPDSVIRACRAALAIRENFEADTRCDSAQTENKQRLGRFRVGIGIATGRAVAGKIGTADQVKVTAFGPVVNLAARLETMTRQIPAAILIDQPSAAALQQLVSSDVCRIRRLGRVQPVGLASPVDVYELIPPEKDCPAIDRQSLAHYEAALSSFEAGDWSQASQRLQKIPDADPAKKYLLHFMAAHRNVPPAGWDGAIHLTTK